MATETNYPGFENDKFFAKRQPQLEIKEIILSHLHDYEEAETFDGTRNERVCKICGQVAPTEITEFDKLSGCLEGDEFLKVRYGPSTHPALQSFLLPTIAHGVKCRDKFVDTDHLAKTRAYTDIQRLCQRFNIPNDFAIEVMRLLLHSGKNLHSRYKPIEFLIDVIKTNPLLENRIAELKALTKEGQKMQKYLDEIKQLKRELAAEKRKHKK